MNHTSQSRTSIKYCHICPPPTRRELILSWCRDMMVSLIVVGSIAAAFLLCTNP
jgi:hypothetical protein